MTQNLDRIRAASAASRPALRPAPRVVTLEPYAFADTWGARPAEPTKVGLRLPSEKVIESAMQLAARDVNRDFREALVEGESEVVNESMVEAYNSQIMVNILAHALCAPEDVSRSFFQTLAVNDMVMVALRPETILLLWNELGALRAELNPTLRLATDDEVMAVGVEPARASNKFRRLLALMHEEMETMTA